MGESPIQGNVTALYPTVVRDKKGELFMARVDSRSLMLGYEDVSDVVIGNSGGTVELEYERCMLAVLTARVRGSSRYRGMGRGITRTTLTTEFERTC